MPRVSQKVAKQTRKRIVESAMDIILTQGTEELTFSSLAVAANISRSGINSHFKLKSDLMQEIKPQILDGIKIRLDYSSPQKFYVTWVNAIDSDVEFCRLLIASSEFTDQPDGHIDLILSISSQNIEITQMYVYQAIGYAVINLKKTLQRHS